MYPRTAEPFAAIDAEQGEKMKALRSIAARWARSLEREDGQALVEYALILSLIAVVAIGALTLTGVRVDSILSSIANNL